jgi:hypothetical protein
MAFIVKDRVQETCTSPGTGTISLLGSVTGFQTFSSAIGNTNTTFYTIADQTGSNWEVGIGTYATSGNTLARTTVLASSNGGSLTNFSSGTQNVWGDYPAGNAVFVSNNPGTLGQVLTSQGTGVQPLWTTLPTNAITLTSQTATAGQTAFTVSYTVNLLLVYRNGVLLNSADFTATNGTSVTLVVGASSGDTVTFAAFAPYSLISATGTGNAVLQTSPTINTPTLTSPIITGSTPQVTTYGSGSGTYTTPANARYLIVEMIGGGGGGSGGGTGTFHAGGAGGATTFGSNTANAGSGGPTPWSGQGGAGGSISVSTGTTLSSNTGATGGASCFLVAGNASNSVPGGTGGSSPYGGAGAGGSYVAGGGSAQPNTGSGGGGGGSGNDVSTVYTGCGGGAGGSIRVLVNSPAATYSYAVGAGGSAGAAGTGSNAATGGIGGSGWLSITAYF